jgi:hypothetical protein
MWDSLILTVLLAHEDPALSLHLVRMGRKKPFEMLVYLIGQVLSFHREQYNHKNNDPEEWHLHHRIQDSPSL